MIEPNVIQIFGGILLCDDVLRVCGRTVDFTQVAPYNDSVSVYLQSWQYFAVSRTIHCSPANCSLGL